MDIDKNSTNYKIDIEQIKTLSTKFTKKTNDDIKSYIILVLILTPIACIVMFLMIVFFTKNGSDIEIYNSNMPGIMMVLLALSCGLLGYIYAFVESRKNNGRSSLSIKVNYDENYVNNKMNELLKFLYYKEKNYKGDKVFYAFKDRYTINTASKKRCISYTIKDGILTIEAWAYMMGRELPIDNRRYGDIIKRALVYDLEYIVNNINKGTYES